MGVHVLLNIKLNIHYHEQLPVYLNVHESINNQKQDVFVKHNAPDNGQFQRRPRSQGQIF